MRSRMEKLWPLNTRVVAGEFVTPRGKKLPAYRGTVAGYTDAYVVVRSDETSRRRLHQLGDLRLCDDDGAVA